MLYEVKTNYERFFTDASRDTLLGWMYEYTQEQLKRGRKREGVVFVWTPVRFVGHAAKHPWTDKAARAAKGRTT